MKTIDEYRAEVVRRHQPAFDLWRATANLFERGLVTARTRPTNTHLVLDMLFAQSSKAHSAVALIGQHGLMEDAATITRRLLEISIQTMFIGEEADDKLRDRKAGSYIAFLWRRLPRKAKAILPPPIREQWSETARRYGRFIPKKRKSWGPTWRLMFRECGVEDLYDTDYAFLSGIAHGSPEEQVFRYSMERLRLHDDRHVSQLLVYSSKYYAVSGEIWNNHFGILPQSDIDRVRERLVNWRFRIRAT